MTGLVAAHRGVLEASVTIVNHVTRADLDRPTPCSRWTLRQLLAHMIGQNYGFAAAADGTTHSRQVFADRPVADEPVADYQASARRVIEAFRVPGVLDTDMYLPEVRGGTTFPAHIAIGFHLVDYVAHGWDVAKSIGITPLFDDAALERALAVAQAVPDEAKSLQGQTPFQPSVTTTSDCTLDRVVATLGRSPDWTPPA